MTTLPPLLLATRNAHKTEEIASALVGMYQVTDLNGTDFPLIEETGMTFIENATLKAELISQITGGIVVSDDSGLEVDALDGKPGVYSSSFGGEEGNHAMNNDRLMSEMAKLEEGVARTARFKCTMVIAKAGEVLCHFCGSVEGSVIAEGRGAGGFGYDPLFIPEGHDQTFAELGNAVKNTMSHRGRALVQVVDFLKTLK